MKISVEALAAMTVALYQHDKRWTSMFALCEYVLSKFHHDTTVEAVMAVILVTPGAYKIA